jgi:hypothetical protein
MSYLSTYDLHNIFLAEHKAIRKKKKKSEQNIKSTEHQILAHTENGGSDNYDRFSLK